MLVFILYLYSAEIHLQLHLLALIHFNDMLSGAASAKSQKLHLPSVPFCIFRDTLLFCSYQAKCDFIHSGARNIFPHMPKWHRPPTPMHQPGIYTSPNLLTLCSTALLCLHHDEESASCRQPGPAAVFLGKHSRKSGQIQGVSETHRERLSCVSLG